MDIRLLVTVSYYFVLWKCNSFPAKFYAQWVHGRIQRLVSLSLFCFSFWKCIKKNVQMGCTARMGLPLNQVHERYVFHQNHIGIPLGLFLSEVHILGCQSRPQLEWRPGKCFDTFPISPVKWLLATVFWCPCPPIIIFTYPND